MCDWKDKLDIITVQTCKKNPLTVYLCFLFVRLPFFTEFYGTVLSVHTARHTDKHQQSKTSFNHPVSQNLFDK